MPGVLSASATLAASTNYGATGKTKDYRAQGIEAEIIRQLMRDFFSRAGYTYVDAQIQYSFTGDAIGPSYNPSFSSIAIGIYSPADWLTALPHRSAHELFSNWLPTVKAICRIQWNTSFALRQQRLYRGLQFVLVGANHGSIPLPSRNLDVAYQKMD